MRKAAPLLLTCLASPAAAAVLATGSGPSVPWFRIILALVACLAVAWGAILLLRRHQRGELRAIRSIQLNLGMFFTSPTRHAPPRLSILETRRASQHGDLCLAELDGELFFLALTPAGTTVIARRAAGNSNASREVAP